MASYKHQEQEQVQCIKVVYVYYTILNSVIGTQ